MHFMDPNNFETIYMVADFVSSGFQTFLVEPAWTFSIWFDTTVYAIGEFLGISE